VSGGIAAGLVLALASAAALNWGLFTQHGAAASLPPLSLRRPWRSLALLFQSRRWRVGFATGIVGWGLYVVALAVAPLSLVQAASAGGIGLLAALVGGLTRRERVAVAGAIAGLALLAVSLIGSSEPTGHGEWPAVAVWMGASVLLAFLLAAPAGRIVAAGAGLGSAAGLLYAAGDVGTKAALAGGGRLAFVPALLACHGLAFAALQLGFQRGSALVTVGLATLWTNALPIAAGTALFAEPIPAGMRGVARVLAFVCVVSAAAVLARGEAPELRAPVPANAV
jgi:hypothetical protein